MRSFLAPLYSTWGSIPIPFFYSGKPPNKNAAEWVDREIYAFTNIYVLVQNVSLRRNPDPRRAARGDLLVLN